MKFEYNDKKYCVFADAEEISYKAYLVHIDEEFVKFKFNKEYCDAYSFKFILNNIKVVNTIEVLKQFKADNRILQAYEVNSSIKELVKVKYHVLPCINDFIWYIAKFKEIKDNILISHREDNVCISLSQEETEEQVKERINADCVCFDEKDKLKYFIL